MKNIIKLSDQQVAELITYREKWIRIGLSTEPIDIPAAEDAIRQCYKLAGLTQPQSILCMDSPLKTVLNEETINIWHQIRDQVRDRVVERAMSRVRCQVHGAVLYRVWMDVCSRVGDSIWDHIWVHVWEHVREHVKNDTRDMGIRYGYGCHDTGWIASYEYFREVCGLIEETEELTGLIALAKYCGWWTPYKDVAFIEHRPCFIGFDDANRLHCENGLAIKYRDGFGIWAIHGIPVDEQIVMSPGKQTIKQIREEENAEKKRIRIERFGWDRYLTEIGAKIINRRHNDIENTEEILVRTPDGMVILLPTCKTGRLFSLEVPSDVSTCEQAQKWLHSGSMLDDIAGKTRVVGRS